VVKSLNRLGARGFITATVMRHRASENPDIRRPVAARSAGTGTGTGKALPAVS